MSNTNTPLKVKLKYLLGVFSGIALVSTPADSAENSAEAEVTCGDRGNIHSLIDQKEGVRGSYKSPCVIFDSLGDTWTFLC